MVAVLEARSSAPCPPKASSHPESRDLERRWAVLKGEVSIPWEAKGVKNHIMQEAEFKVGERLSQLGEVDLLAL